MKNKVNKSTTKNKSSKQVINKTTKPTLVTKRFVIRKSIVGQGIIFKYTNYDGKVCDYNHDKVYKENQERFDNMPCFKKYKIYTQSFNLPKFVRDMKSYI